MCTRSRCAATQEGCSAGSSAWDEKGITQKKQDCRCRDFTSKYFSGQLLKMCLREIQFESVKSYFWHAALG